MWAKDLNVILDNATLKPYTEPMDNMNPLHTSDDCFYFVAQTGVWKLCRPLAPSNFHVYQLPYAQLAKVQAAVRDADVAPEGLVYPQEFVVWLERNDKGDA